MPRSVHVRLDDEAAAALSVLRADGLSDSEAVRLALREAAARQLARARLTAQAQKLAADSSDRAEIAAIHEDLAELRPRGG
jgi:Arc/MetJ-type ribon-helix-helix transcriptional regulator